MKFVLQIWFLSFMILIFGHSALAQALTEPAFVIMSDEEKLSNLDKTTTYLLEGTVLRNQIKTGLLHGVGTGAGYTHHVTSVSISGYTSASIVNDQCTGLSLPSGVYCTFEYEATSTSVGEINFVISVTGTSIHPIYGSNPFEDHKDITIFVDEVEGKSQCPVTVSGSIVRIENQSVSERIDIVGSELSLYYSSEFADEYDSSIKLVKQPFFAPELITLSAHNYYDINKGRLYYGTGTSKKQKSTPLSGGYLRVIEPDGSLVYTFDSSGKHLNTLEPIRGKEIYTFNYDSNNKLESIEDPYNNQTKVLRDSSGKLIGIEAPYGQITSIALNAQGLVSTITNPNSEIHNFTYSTGTELLSEYTDPNGNTRFFNYNTEGRLTLNLGADGTSRTIGVITYEDKQEIYTTQNLGSIGTLYEAEFIDVNDYRRTVTHANTYVTTNIEYRNGGYKYIDDVSSITTSVGEDVRFGSNVKQLTSQTIKQGSLTNEVDYTYYTSPITLTDPFVYSILYGSQNSDHVSQSQLYYNGGSGLSEMYFNYIERVTEFNSHQQPISYQVGYDTPYDITYDIRGRVASIQQGLKNGLTFTYNSDGFLQTVENLRNEEILYTYDLAGRVISTTLPDSRVISYTYDANGNLTSVTPPSKPTHSLLYNGFDFVSEYSPPWVSGLTNKNTEYTYNAIKQISQITRPSGDEVHFQYNGYSGFLTKQYSGSLSNNFTYNSSAQLSQSDFSAWSNHPSQTEYYTYTGHLPKKYQKDSGYIEYSYNDGLQRTSYSVSDGTSLGTSIDYTYDYSGLLLSVGTTDYVHEYSSGRLQAIINNTTGLGTSKTLEVYSYDTYGALVGYEAKLDGNLVFKYTLTRDLMNRITTKVEEIPSESPSIKTYSYTYDNAGRLTGVTTDFGYSSSYVYDSNGNRVSGSVGGTPFTATYDDQDRLLTYNSKSYEYNDNGDLVKATDGANQTVYMYDGFGNLRAFGATSNPVDLYQYQYDSDMRRISRLEFSGNPTHELIYDGNFKIAGILDASGDLETEMYGISTINTQDTILKDGSKYAIFKDHLGSPRFVVKYSGPGTNGVVVLKNAL